MRNCTGPGRLALAESGCPIKRKREGRAGIGNFTLSAYHSYTPPTQRKDGRGRPETSEATLKRVERRANVHVWIMLCKDGTLPLLYRCTNAGRVIPSKALVILSRVFSAD